jgi:predicted outer membrane repeat protein
MLVADTTWSPACGPYVVTGNLLVPNGVTLTVEAGTTVRFAGGTALQVDGILQAQGVADAMVTFTSNLGGAPGDWGYILLRETVAPQPFDDLDFVLIEYAGGVSITNNAALRVDGAWPGLHDITVRHSASDGVRFWNGAIGSISRSTIYDNAGWGVYANSTALSAANGALHVHDNGGGGIYVTGSGPYWLSGSVIRQNSGRGLEVRGSALDVYVHQTLVRGNSANTGGGIYVYQATLDLSGSWILGNTATGGSDGGGIFCGTGSICRIERNVIGDNSAGDQGGGIQVAGGLTGSPHAIEHNIIFDNAAASGGGLAVIAGSVESTVANNAFLGNTATGHGAALYVTRDISITQNTVLHNMAGLGLGGIYAKNHPVFQWNNLYENADYDLYNDTPQGSADLNAEVNWWGTADPALIMAHIWDWFDNPALGLVDYDPWLTSHFLAAPISPPLGLAATSNGVAFSLAWQSNPEADLDGYKVYYGRDGPGFPYSGTGASEGDSPVDVGNVLSATLSGLPPGTYYLAVTAYDTNADGVDDQTDGNESWFAHEVAISPQSCCDFDGDGAIDVDDIAIIAGLWDQPAAATYDLDGDGWITMVDVQRTARWWGWSVP